MATSSKRSGNPAKKATTAKKWKRNKGEELPLPSGNVALVKRPGPAALLDKGILPDSLMPIVQQAIKSGKGLKPEDEAELMKDPEKILEALDAMDRLLPVVVVEPRVLYHKREIEPAARTMTPGEAYGPVKWEDIPDQSRFAHAVVMGVPEAEAEDVLWSDEVDIEDKMFIFQYAVGGTRDLERFRSELGVGLGDLSAGEGTPDAPVGPSGDSQEGGTR